MTVTLLQRPLCALACAGVGSGGKPDTLAATHLKSGVQEVSKETNVSSRNEPPLGCALLEVRHDFQILQNDRRTHLGGPGEPKKAPTRTRTVDLLIVSSVSGIGIRRINRFAIRAEINKELDFLAQPTLAILKSNLDRSLHPGRVSCIKEVTGSCRLGRSGILSAHHPTHQIQHP